VEVTDLPVVEDKALRWLIECVFVVENALLQAAEPILVCFGGDSGVSLVIGNGLKETIGDGSKEGGIQVRLSLESRLDGMG
jgi:hypothetical protein